MFCQITLKKGFDHDLGSGFGVTKNTLFKLCTCFPYFSLLSCKLLAKVGLSSSDEDEEAWDSVRDFSAAVERDGRAGQYAAVIQAGVARPMPP